MFLDWRVFGEDLIIRSAGLAIPLIMSANIQGWPSSTAECTARVVGVLWGSDTRVLEGGKAGGSFLPHRLLVEAAATMLKDVYFGATVCVLYSVLGFEAEIVLLAAA